MERFRLNVERSNETKPGDLFESHTELDISLAKIRKNALPLTSFETRPTIEYKLVYENAGRPTVGSEIVSDPRLAERVLRHLLGRTVPNEQEQKTGYDFLRSQCSHDVQPNPFPCNQQSRIIQRILFAFQKKRI